MLLKRLSLTSTRRQHSPSSSEDPPFTNDMWSSAQVREKYNYLQVKLLTGEHNARNRQQQQMHVSFDMRRGGGANSNEDPRWRVARVSACTKRKQTNNPAGKTNIDQHQNTTYAGLAIDWSARPAYVVFWCWSSCFFFFFSSREVKPTVLF